MPDEPVSIAFMDERGVILVSGEIDVASAPALKRALHHAYDQSADKLVVDLSGVQFLDAAGIGAMVEVANRATDEGRTLVVTRPSQIVQRLIDILGDAWPLDTI